MRDNETVQNAVNMVTDYLTERYEGDTPPSARVQIAAMIAPELLAEIQTSFKLEYNSFEPDNQSERYKRLKDLVHAAGKA